MTKSYKSLFFILVVLLLLLVLVSLNLGQMNISLSQIVNVFDLNSDAVIRDVILNLRLPRILFAALVGCGLALCGYVMQASVQNPLADPYILGISSGASLGATVAILLGVSIPGLSSEFMISIWAFAGATLAIVLVYFTASYRNRLTTMRLVLSGVIVNTLCTAISNMLIYSAKDIEGIRSITFWTMGSLTNVTWMEVVVLGVILLLIIGYFLTQLRPLNIISLGDETAVTLGVNVNKQRKIHILIVTFLTGIIVAQCGIIGFVGLIVPHAVRAACKSANSNILPIVLVSGSVFLVFVDLLSRVLLANQEIPIGIITSIIGAPLFLFIFVKHDYGS